jgi:hypothetical protein
MGRERIQRISLLFHHTVDERHTLDNLGDELGSLELPTFLGFGGQLES